VRGDGRGALLRGKCDASGGVQIWGDPEAAGLWRGWIAVEMVGWHLCRGEAVLNLGEIKKGGIWDGVGKFAIEWQQPGAGSVSWQTGEHGISLPDPVAMAVALDPSIVTSASEHFWMWRRRAS